MSNLRSGSSFRSVMPWIFIGFAAFLVLALMAGTVMAGRDLIWLLWIIMGATVLLAVAAVIRQSSTKQQLQLAAVLHEDTNTPVHQVVGETVSAGQSNGTSTRPPAHGTAMTIAAKNQEVVIAQTRLDGWSMLQPIFVVILVSGLLVMLVTYARDNSLGGVLLLIAAALLVLTPYTEASLHQFRAIRVWWRKWRLSIIVSLVVVALVTGACVVIFKPTWMLPALENIATWVWNTLQFVFQSQISTMAVLLVIAGLKLGLAFYAWRFINTVRLLHSSEEANRYGYDIQLLLGIFRRRKPIVKGSKITNLEPQVVSIFGLSPSWCKVIVEDPGQEQGFSEIHWLPKRFLIDMKLADPMEK